MPYRYLNQLPSFLDTLNWKALSEHFIVILIALFIGAILINYVTKLFIRFIIYPLIRKTRIKLDDQLIEHQIILRLSHIIPAIVIHVLGNGLFKENTEVSSWLNLTLHIYVIIIVLFVIDGIINFIRSIWENSNLGNRYPAKSFAQAAKIIINLIGLVLIFSGILGKSPLVIFSGLGAVTAILLLIFKDAILGLVAGFQLSVNHMIMVGDWIEMPARGADGDVIDVSLTTVKVQNFDKTITTVPTYALISDSFKNWRAMSESGGRRIKRSLHIDIQTIRFVDDLLLDRFKKIRILKPYLTAKLEEIQSHNSAVSDNLDELINGRRLTNIGTFRAYCLAYLREHLGIRSDMTLLVRQLAPSSQGLPIEIYVFTKDTAWITYEDIQSDIFDHLLSIMPEFGLQAFQMPSSEDLGKISRTSLQV